MNCGVNEGELTLGAVVCQNPIVRINFLVHCLRAILAIRIEDS